MEHLLHYLWKHKIFPLQELRTTDGQQVEVIDPGLPNTDAGPDFFNAKLKLDGILWVGNVELHDRSSLWLKHGHQSDAAYDNVILHVVGEADCPVFRRNGQPIPQLVLTCPADVARRYDELRRSEIHPPCYSILSSLPKLTVHSWLSALQVERFERKARDIRARLDAYGNHWEDVFFVTLARNYGFGLNSDAFEAWARLVPFRAVDKHRDNTATTSFRWKPSSSAWPACWTRSGPTMVIITSASRRSIATCGRSSACPLRWTLRAGGSCASVPAASPMYAWPSWPTSTIAGRRYSRG